jgi:transcriptional repressor of cell division inhibition gene dicB
MYKRDVVAYYGTLSAITKVLGLKSSGTVSLWQGVIPEKQALRLEKLTKGQLKYDPKLYERAA